jgi:D-glycero-D-manno-heptose 1,7-bisphosphate phosphatase
LGYLLVVVTNQAGIARGQYTESDFLDLTDWMIQRFAEKHIEIARVYYCPYHPIHGVGRYKYDSPDRKPNPGMLLRAQADFNLDMGASVLIGDQDSDIRAGKSAGVGTRILLRPAVSDLPLLQDEYFVAESLDQIRLRFLTPAPQETGTEGRSFHRTSKYD